MAKKINKQVTANYYGKVEILPGLVCDGYILSDGRPVLSERGAADLMGLDHMVLQRLCKNEAKKLTKNTDQRISMSMETKQGQKSPDAPKNKEKSMETKLTRKASQMNFLKESKNDIQDIIQFKIKVKVLAKDSPYKNRKIVVYDADFVGNAISSYAYKFVRGELRENQLHVGQRCAMIQLALTKGALAGAIREACGFNPEIQSIVRRYYVDTLYKKELPYLWDALQVAYPDREPYKYGLLLSTVFEYAYKDIIGKEQYKLIKGEKKNYHAVHQYIEDNNLREDCQKYIWTFAAILSSSGDRLSEVHEKVKKFLGIR